LSGHVELSTKLQRILIDLKQALKNELRCAIAEPNANIPKIRDDTIRELRIYHITIDTVTDVVTELIRELPPERQAKVFVQDALEYTGDKVYKLSEYYRKSGKKTQEEMKKLSGFEEIARWKAPYYFAEQGRSQDLKNEGRQILRELNGQALLVPILPALVETLPRWEILKFFAYDTGIQWAIKQAVAEYANIPFLD
jgi:hypothetical protein